MSTCRGTAFSTPPVICEQIPNVIGMLSHQQNLHVLRGRKCTGRGEARSHERIKFIKNHPVFLGVYSVYAFQRTEYMPWVCLYFYITYSIALKLHPSSEDERIQE
jgi:hypothetical protein